MENKLRTVIDALKQKKVSYADARYLDTKNESIEVKNGYLSITAANTQ